MTVYNNWKCYAYRFDHNRQKDYSYAELKEFFYIDGSRVVYCKKDFENCKTGNYYLVYDEKLYSGWQNAKSGFCIIDWLPFNDWINKEYMKEN